MNQVPMSIPKPVNSNIERIKNYTNRIKQKATTIKQNTYENVKEKINNKQLYSKLNIDIIFFIFFIIYIIIVIIIFKKNPYNFISKYNTLSILASLFGSFLLLMLFFFIKKRIFFFKDDSEQKPSIASFMLKIFTFFLTMGFIGFAIFGTIYLFKHTSILSNIILYILNLLIIIGFVTIMYVFLKPILLNMKTPITKRIIDIITYIPQLILDIINYFIIQYNITTKPVWILFCLEIIFIVLSIILPYFFNKIINHDTIVLLNNPKSLRLENLIGNFEILNKEKINKYNYNYAISSWIYLEAQSASTNTSYSDNATILSYGGKPNIYYNGNTNELVISAKIGHEDKIIYRTNDIPYQKWFNIIINYQGGYMDIFIDKKLTISVKNIVPYMTYDNIIIGKNNGIYGFISNVNYFNKTISKDKISWIYKSTKI